jgi:Icc-related predicted phosphoesterase
MRVFAVSDVHIDYEINAKWLANLSIWDYQQDILILAGDVTDDLHLLDWCLTTLKARFRCVMYVPGNHELWVIRDVPRMTSLQKFAEVMKVAGSCGVSTRVHREQAFSIVPLLGWYDHSFGEPGEELKSMWMDFHACNWPSRMSMRELAAHFANLNDEPVAADSAKIITFSHFLPRIDLMPHFIPQAKRLLYPVLGSELIEQQLRNAKSSMHVYGHSHVNRAITIDGVKYVNNAFGYPQETWIAAKRLLCIYEA